MKKALFCYFGRFYDHKFSQPGHCLYTLFYLNFLKQYFKIDKFDVYYYDKHKETLWEKKYEALAELRSSIYDDIIDDDDLPLSEVFNRLDSYDHVFLKYRFRNLSRLNSGSLDRLKYDEIYKRCDPYIIDTDAEIAEHNDKVITLFNKPYKYDAHAVFYSIPVLKDDMIKALEYYNCDKIDRLTFIGNQYFKEDILGVLERIKVETGLNIVVSGKWSKYSFIDHCIDRTARGLAYTSLSQSVCTIQKSKRVYDEYDFLSPRIFESFLLGTICFGNSSFMPKFCRYHTMYELTEKIKFLQSIKQKPEYKDLLFSCINELYENISIERCK